MHQSICIVQFIMCYKFAALFHDFNFLSCFQLLCGWTERGQIIWKISSCWWIYVYGWMACICLLNAQILNEWISRKNYHCFAFLCFFISIFMRKKCQYIHRFSQGECHLVCLITQQHLIILTILFKSFAKLEMGKLKRQNKTTATTKRFFQLEINANTCFKIFVPTV